MFLLLLFRLPPSRPKVILSLISVVLLIVLYISLLNPTSEQKPVIIHDQFSGEMEIVLIPGAMYTVTLQTGEMYNLIFVQEQQLANEPLFALRYQNQNMALCTLSFTEEPVVVNYLPELYECVVQQKTTGYGAAVVLHGQLLSNAKVVSSSP